VPRRQDPDLEGKILDAAQKLWKRGGQKSLTMRTVAKAAGTNTPAVYRRFKDRDDILRTLLNRLRLEIAGTLEGARSPEEGCERYLDFALSHPHEYELFFQHNYELEHSPRARRSGGRPMGQPARDAMRKKLAEKFGGAPSDYGRMVVALWMVGHGAAMLMIAKSILPDDAKAARAIYSKLVKALLEAAQRGEFRGRAAAPASE
jgi:AcrR family transcriptional regulator